MNSAKGFRDILSDEFLKRLKANGNYRMLDFANELGIPASRMSEIMSGRLHLSIKRALKFSEKLNFSEDEKASFLTLVNESILETKKKRSHQAKNLKDRRARLSKVMINLPSHLKDELLASIDSVINKWISEKAVDTDAEETTLTIEIFELHR
jgi:plasmid maintenance system antidote protein VapI